MQNNATNFYKPYLSESEESESDSGSDSDFPSSIPPVGSLKSMVQSGSMPVNTVVKQIDLRTQKSGPRNVQYSAFDLSGADPTSGGGTKFDMTNGIYTTILMINSRDRDTEVYPQPTFFTIRLPRTYRNITSFQITQMKLLSSFFYFRDNKENTTMDVLEQGRTATIGGRVVDNVIKVRIREGSYNINTLLTELQTQMNRTPLFFYFPNGFSDFITQFTAAGDLSVNFNEPGDFYFDSLTDQFVASPTKNFIVTQYFASRYAGLSTYTLSQVKVAYYYPVLYEMILDPEWESQLNLTYTGSGLLPGETVRSRILYTFQGLNDPVILTIIDQNLAIIPNSGYLTTPGASLLDIYRTLHTFVYSLVNEYKCSYETNSNRIVISSTQLNTSLFTLLTNQTTAALLAELQNQNLTIAQYSNLLTSNTLYTAVFSDMYNTLQKKFATYFAVNFGTYAPEFYTNVTNAPYLQNGIGAVGVATGYSLALLQSGQEPISSSAQALQNSPGYWPQIQSNPVDASNNVLFVGAGLNTRIQDISAGFINVPYNTISATVDTSTQFIDNSGSIYINPLTSAGDIVTPILNSKYTVFRFRSFVRQTLQVETLPLPYYYRYPTLNTINYEPPIPEYFDASYVYINSPYLTRTDISNVTVPFASTFSVQAAASKYYEFTVRNAVRYYSFVAPQPKSRTTLVPLNDASGYKYPLQVNVFSTDILGAINQFSSQMQIYFYHDQGAFFADISGYRNENPYNYKATYTATTDISCVTFTTNVFANQTYYLIIRSSNVSFQNQYLKVCCSFPSQLQTPIARYQFNQSISPLSTPTLSYPVTSDVSYNLIWATEYDQDFIRLPTSSNIMGKDPSSAEFNKYLPVALTPIGYDISGVSSDLTDYRGFTSNIIGNVPFTTFRVDPTNQYTFQNLSGYNINCNTYFPTSGTSNAVLQPISNSPYTLKTIPDRQFKIVNWYDQQYIPTQKYQPGIPNSNFVAKSRVVDASYGALDGYVYDASGNPGGSSTGLRFDDGIIGFGFIPNEGVWSAEEIVFKSAYMERPTLSSNFTDPNKKIKYLGIFPTGTITNYQFSDISLNYAIYKLNYTSSITYTPDKQAIYSGFDPVGGTYHTFKKDGGFVSQTGVKLVGYTPSVTYNFNTNSYFSVIAYDSSQNVIPFYTLMGSYVPYPTVSKPIATSNYSDTYGTYSNADGKGFYYPQILPSYNSNYYPSDSNIFRSRYEQSIPWNTNLLHTKTNTNPLGFSNGYYYYSFNPNINYQLDPSGSYIPPGTYPANSAETNITLLSKGPYFFHVTSETLSNTFAVTPKLIMTSNTDKRFTLCNIALRNANQITSCNLNSIPFDPPLLTDPNFGAPSPFNPLPTPFFLSMTANGLGSNDLDNIYCLHQTHHGTAISTGMGFTISKLRYDTSRVGGPFYFQRITSTITCAVTTSNGSFIASYPPATIFPSPFPGGFVFGNPNFPNSNQAYRNINFTKFYVTENNLAFFQFADAYSHQTGGSNLSYFCVYNMGTESVKQFSLNTYSNLFDAVYTWDKPSSNPGPSYNIYYDWCVDRRGKQYTAMASMANLYFTVFAKQYQTNGDLPTTTDVLTSAGSAALSSNYGIGCFNQIRVDSNYNLFFQQAYISGNNYIEPAHLLTKWSTPLYGHYGYLPYSNYSSGGSAVVNFSVNKQTFDATVLDSGYSEGFPLISSDLLIGLRQGVGPVQPLFSQVATQQSFFFNRFRIMLNDTDVPITGRIDISGFYDVTFDPFNFTVPNIAAQYTQTELLNYINGYLQSNNAPSIITTTLTMNDFATTNPRIIYDLYVPLQVTGITLNNVNIYDGRSLTPMTASATLSPRTPTIFTYPNLWGNSQFGVDLLSPTACNAWQVMYPTVKIVMKKVQNGFTPITETTDLTTYPSYSHTAMFYYDNYKDLSNDIFNKFGQESKARFKAYDVSSGYEFKSYIYNISLNPYKGSTKDISGNTGYNYLAVRGYSPTEKFNCLTRFYLPGRYDFGFIPLQDLSNETQTVLVDLSGSPLVNPVYQTVLNAFNNSFKGSFTFGSNAIAGFSGSNYTFTGFSSFLQKYISVYNTGQANAQLLATITSNVNAAVASYIQTYLSGILPSYVLQRQRFTDPLLFSFLFNSGLSDVRKSLEYEWGLGWNLGYPKVDTPYDTIQRATSFFKILDDYIYLKLNQEFTMNRLDSSGPEKLSITHEPTGQTNQFAAKLLLAPFGSYAQTMIQNPINFNPVLTSIDRLTFQWVDLTGTQIDNLDCEWNAAVQISEQVTQATTTSTIPRASIK
jgi:hypothetical protein